MAANSTGIAGAPGQIADGVNTDYVAQVYSDLALKVRFSGITASGSTDTAIALDAAGRITLSERAVLQAVLQESRLQTYLLFCLCTNQPVPDDLDALRREPSLVRDTDLIELEN